MIRSLLIFILAVNQQFAIGQSADFNIVHFSTQNDYLFRMQVSRFYPLKEQMMGQYAEDWSWTFLSLNESLAWSDELIDKFEDKWSWFDLQRNPGIAWTETGIEKLRQSKRLNWPALCLNPALLVTEAFLQKYEDEVEWHNLRKNPAFSSQKHLVKKYKSRLENLPDDSEYYYNPPAQLTDTYLEYGDAWKRLNPHLTAEKLPAELESARLKPIAKIDTSLFGKYHGYWNWYRLPMSEDLPWSPDFFERYLKEWPLESLADNKGFYQKVYSKHLNDSVVEGIMQRLNPPGAVRFYMLVRKDDEFGLIPGVTTSKGSQDKYYEKNFKPDAIPDSLPTHDFFLGGNYEPPLRFADLHDWSAGRPYGVAAIVVSEKVKSVLERFKIPPHRFYPIDVQLNDARYGKENRRYFIFQIAECDYQYLDYDAVKFHWSDVNYAPGKRARLIGVPLEKDLKSPNDYLAFRDSIRKSPPPHKQFAPLEYIWKADFDVMACRSEEILNPIWVSQEVKAALEAVGVTGIAFKKVRETSPRMSGVETEEHRRHNARIVGNIRQEWSSGLSEPEQLSVARFRKDCARRDSILEQKGAVKRLRQQSAAPQARPKSVTFELLQKEEEWDVLLPPGYFGMAANLNYSLDFKSLVQKAGYELLPIDQLEQVGEEWYNGYPFTVKAVLFANNGVGDYLGFLLKPGSAYELDDIIYEFWHETGEIKPIGKL